ncbi:hypothetical protein, partial [Phyllobacterium sp. P5_D12]
READRACTRYENQHCYGFFRTVQMLFVGSILEAIAVNSWRFHRAMIVQINLRTLCLYVDAFWMPSNTSTVQPVQVHVDTSENGTIGAMIDHGYTL